MNAAEAGLDVLFCCLVASRLLQAKYRAPLQFNTHRQDAEAVLAKLQSLLASSNTLGNAHTFGQPKAVRTNTG